MIITLTPRKLRPFPKTAPPDMPWEGHIQCSETSTAAHRSEQGVPQGDLTLRSPPQIWPHHFQFMVQRLLANRTKSKPPTWPAPHTSSVYAYDPSLDVSLLFPMLRSLLFHRDFLGAHWSTNPPLLPKTTEPSCPCEWATHGRVCPHSCVMWDSYEATVPFSAQACWHCQGTGTSLGAQMCQVPPSTGPLHMPSYLECFPLVPTI